MRHYLHFLYTVLCMIDLTGCHKKFDAPPDFTGEDIHANLSIRDLRAMHFTGSFEQIQSEFIIEGIVIADDGKDNFYKSIVIQDSTGGITIRMDGTGLYNEYPVGRRVAVRLKDLWLGDYAKMMQLGAGVDRSDPLYPELQPIPTILFTRFLVKKELNNPVVPIKVRLDQLNDSLQSCLLQIDNVEFAAADTGKPYADAINKTTDNATLKACGGGSLVVRTSGFADFASAKIPRGNGSVTAVYSVFKTEKQLLLRDTSDVRLTGLRCSGSGPKLLFSEDFETAAPNSLIAIAGWKNIVEAGNSFFTARSTANEHFAEISAFATGKTSVISWLILPPINLNNSANEILRFQTQDGFDNGGILQVYVSTNYDGGNTPSKAKWTALKAVIAKGSVSAQRSDWLSSGDISLSGFSGQVYIAFRYDGADPAGAFDKRTTTFRIDNIRIEGN